MRHEPVREVTQTIPVEKLDARAQVNARVKWEMFRETVYAYDDVARWICSVNQPHADDGRKWFKVEGLDES